MLELDFQLDQDAIDMNRTQRHQLFAAAAAGNLSPIPSDNENSEHVNSGSISEHYDIEHDELNDELDINAEQPPEWSYSLSDGEEDENLSRQRSFGGSDDSLEGSERTAELDNHMGESNGIKESPSPLSNDHHDTPKSPMSPMSPVSPVSSIPSKAEPPKEEVKKGPRIVVPKNAQQKTSTSNGNSAPPKKTLYKPKPAKSRLPKMEHVMSSIPKPRPVRQNSEPRPVRQNSAEKIDPKKTASTPRENKSSIHRKKNLHVQMSRDKEEEEKELDYLTPLQKKNSYIKELEQKLKETKAKLEEREKELQEADAVRAAKVEFAVREKMNENAKLRGQVAELEIANQGLAEKYEEAMKTIQAYEGTVNDLKVGRG